MAEEEIKKEPDMIDKANEAAKRIEEANKKAEELAAKMEKLVTQQILGGRSAAGAPMETLTPEEKDKAEIRRQANVLTKPYGLDLDAQNQKTAPAK